MTEHKAYVCPPSCDLPDCNFCEGGLFLCTVCDCAEGSLATECPGHRVSMAQQDLIMTGELDYEEGRWWDMKRCAKCQAVIATHSEIVVDRKDYHLLCAPSTDPPPPQQTHLPEQSQ